MSAFLFSFGFLVSWTGGRCGGFFLFLLFFFAFIFSVLSCAPFPSLFFLSGPFPSLVLPPLDLALRDSGVAPPFSRLSTVNRRDIISGIHFRYHLTDEHSNVRRWLPPTKLWGGILAWVRGPRSPFEGPFGLDGNAIGNLSYCRCFIRQWLSCIVPCRDFFGSFGLFGTRADDDDDDAFFFICLIYLWVFFSSLSLG